MIDGLRMATPYHLIPTLLLAAPLPAPFYQLRVRHRVRPLLSHCLLGPRVFELRVLAEVLLL